MRRYLPLVFLVLVAPAPVVLVGCDLVDKLKGGGGDAAADAAVVAVAVPDAAAATAAPTDTAPPATAPALSGGTVPAPVNPTVRPVTDGGVRADAAAPVDAGPVKDGGAAPAPTPTLTIPTLPFDAGLLPKFDAGGFKPPWQK